MASSSPESSQAGTVSPLVFAALSPRRKAFVQKVNRRGGKAQIRAPLKKGGSTSLAHTVRWLSLMHATENKGLIATWALGKNPQQLTDKKINPLDEICRQFNDKKVQPNAEDYFWFGDGCADFDKEDLCLGAPDVPIPPATLKLRFSKRRSPHPRHQL